jgi:hypothetical protein
MKNIYSFLQCACLIDVSVVHPSTLWGGGDLARVIEVSLIPLVTPTGMCLVYLCIEYPISGVYRLILVISLRRMGDDQCPI